MQIMRTCGRDILKKTIEWYEKHHPPHQSIPQSDGSEEEGRTKKSSLEHLPSRLATFVP